MTRQIINIGSAPNSRDGDSIRSAFAKINANFTELYTAFRGWRVVRSTYTAQNGDRIIADTSSGSFTITLPSSPTEGFYIEIADGGDFSANNLLLTSVRPVESFNQDIIFDIKGLSLEFVYVGTAWQILTTLGVKGDKGDPGEVFVLGSDYNINIIGDDSSKIVNVANNSISASSVTGGSIRLAGRTIDTVDSSAITIDQATTVTSDLTVGGDIVPSTANGGNLGSLAKPFRSLFVSNNTIFLGNVPLSLEPGTNELRVNNVPISQTITYADIPGVPTDIPDLSAVSESIIPDTDVAYDLGSPTNRFRTLYLSGNTIDLGGALISATDDGNVSLPGVTETKFKPGSIQDNRQPGEPFFNETAISEESVIIDFATFGWAINDPAPPDPYLPTFQPSIYSATFNGSGFITAITLVTANYYGEDDVESIIIGNGDTMIALAPGTALTRAAIRAAAQAAPFALPLAAGVLSTSESVFNSASLTIPVDIDDLTDTGNLLFDGDYTSLSNRPTIPVDIDDLTDTGNLLASELVSPTVPTIGGTASAGEAGITYLSGDLSKWAIFTVGAFTIGEWTDVQPGWTVTDNNGFTDIIAGRGSFGAASFQTTVNSWPSPASGKTYVFTSPDYQLGYTNPVEITVGSNDWTFDLNGVLTLPIGATNNGRISNINGISLAVDTSFWTFDPNGALTIPGDIRSESAINIDINLSDSTLRRWRFGEDGDLTLPAGGTIAEGVVTENPTIELTPANPEVESQKLVIKGGQADNLHLHLTTGDLTETSVFLGTDEHNIRTYPDGTVIINTYDYGAETPEVKGFSFTPFGSGQMFFPDGTLQNTAWAGGQVKIFPPGTSKGSEGDKERDIAFDSNYFYYCTADYTDGIENIWKRVAWSNDTWGG